MAYYSDSNEMMQDTYNLNESAILEMSNLSPKRTGIDNVVIWVGPGLTNHGPRIKVLRNLQDKSDGFVVSISDDPEVKAGDVFVDAKAVAKIIQWVKLNKKVLLDYANQKIYTEDMLARIKSV